MLSSGSDAATSSTVHRVTAKAAAGRLTRRFANHTVSPEEPVSWSVDSASASRGSRRGQNTFGPRTDIIAGTNVTEMSSPTRIVSAIAGPNAWKNCSSATSSTAVPADTVRPAATMIGV